MIARVACAISWLLAFPCLATALDGNPVIALPDLPVVIPYTYAGQSNITTQLNNNARQGANLAETILNPRNVGHQTFGILQLFPVMGQVLAQPLYVRNVDLGNLGQKNLIIVATAANMVYAFDANDRSSIPKAVFSAPLVPPPLKAIDPGGCGETYPPYIGVTSTPVIDVSTGSVFVVAFNSATAQQELHKLNLRDRFASDQKVVMLPPGESAGQWPTRERNRAALLLSQGVVYVAFSSFLCDHPQPYAGWVLGYRASDLVPVAHWETPHPDEFGSSGIWQSGRGLVADDGGNIYLMTGNDSNFSTLTDHTNDNDSFTDYRLANSFVKLSPSGPNGLEVVKSFTPKNSSQLSAGDTDLGSSGPILLPGERLVGGGKQGRTYVLDSLTMQSLQNHTVDGDGFQGFQAFVNNYHLVAPPAQPSCTQEFDNHNPDQYCRRLQAADLLTPAKCPYPQGSLPATPNGPLISSCYLPTACYQFCQAYGPNIHAGFVYWRPAFDWGLIYAMPEKEHVKALKYDLPEKRIEESPVAQSDVIVPDGMPGGALSLSANGTQDGIVWASLPNRMDATNGVHRGSLVALDAINLHELWRDDCVWYFAKFNPPTVADGHVFLATFADPAVAPTTPRRPGQNCDLPEPPAPLSPTPSVGTAWVIEYGLLPHN
jgi:hypothetical protein